MTMKGKTIGMLATLAAVLDSGTHERIPSIHVGGLRMRVQRSQEEKKADKRRKAKRRISNKSRKNNRP